MALVGDLFDGYGEETSGPLGGAFDEVVGDDGSTRAPYLDVVSVLSQMSPDEIAARTNRLARAFMDQGVTFDLDGEERPFPLDIVPRIFSSREWDTVEEGVAQRVRALEAFLADVYNEGRILDDGIVPYRAVTSSPGFLREVCGVNPANGVRIHVAGIDVIRDEEGHFRVLEDNIRCPSGVSYVLANRAAMARVLPEVFGGQPIHMVADYPARLVRALRLAAPPGVSDPTIVVLTPGVHNSAFYGTRSWPASWASISSRAGTSYAGGTTSSSGRPTGRCPFTSSTAGSTTRSPTRSNSARSPWWAARDW